MYGALNNVYNNVMIALSNHSAAMNVLQEQASTGSRINRTSDDPAGAYRVLGLKSQGRELENYIDNLSDITSTLEFSTSVLNDMTDNLADAKVRITQITSEVYDADARKRTAAGIDDILEQVVSLANTRHTNEYLFAGAATGSAPYVVQRDNDGKIVSVSYQGSGENRDIEVAPGVEASPYRVGSEMFGSNERSVPIFIGDTGVTKGTGTSSVDGFVWLEITQPGGAGTAYKLSIDDGASFTSVDVPPGSANTAVTHASTGDVVYVDTTNITDTGYELVSVPGTHDIFNLLITIRDVLANEKNLPEDQVNSIIDNLVSGVNEVNQVLLQNSVSVGSKIGFLDDLKDSLTTLNYDTEDEVTHLEEADLTQIAIELSRRELLYQMSLSVAGEVMSLSLLDFIK